MEEKMFEIIETEEKTWRIEIPMVRAWLFAGEEKALLVDTTAAHGDILAAVRTVTDLPVTLLNTHSDPDHIASNDCFDTALMHEDEIDRYRSKSGEHFAAPKAVREGERIDLGGRVFEVLHIPGHTPGSIALLDRERRLLVSGDTVSAGPIFLFGPGRDIPLFRKTLYRLKEMSGEFDTIYTSHGPFSAGPEQIENQIRCLEECQKGTVPAEEPPMPIPAKMYCACGAGYFLAP